MMALLGYRLLEIERIVYVKNCTENHRKVSGTAVIITHEGMSKLVPGQTRTDVSPVRECTVIVRQGHICTGQPTLCISYLYQ